jgi:hypothetical protein
MASHSQDSPHTLSTLEMSNSPQDEEERLFPDIPYALPHGKLNQFIKITRAYARQIDTLSLAPILPKRKKVSIPVVDTLDQVFVNTVEDLIDFSLIEIERPINLIPEMPANNVSEPDDFFEEEGFNSERSVSGYEYMEDNNDHDEERGNPRQKNQPWLARDALAIPG